MGSNGAGKSTLLRSCLQHVWPMGLTLRIPRKQTTRPILGPQELIELEHVSLAAFEERRANGAYLVTYESYGESYALARAEFPTTCELDVVLLQTAPGSVANHLRQELGSRYTVKICALEAPRFDIRILDRSNGRSERGILYVRRLEPGRLSRSSPSGVSSVIGRIRGAEFQQEDCSIPATLLDRLAVYGAEPCLMRRLKSRPQRFSDSCYARPDGCRSISSAVTGSPIASL